MTEWIETKDSFMASYTSWCVDDNGNFSLVLHDKDDKPIALATYTYDQWINAFSNLTRIFKELANPTIQ